MWVLAAAAPMVAGALPGSAAAACDPTVTGVGAPGAVGAAHPYAPPGAQVTVTGANFSQSGCSLAEVEIGTSTIPAADVAVASDGSSLTFSLPAGASGPVSVVTADQGGQQARSNTNLVFIETPAASVQTASPAEAGLETVTGSGFMPFSSGQPQSLADASVVGTYSGCGGTPEQAAGTAASDTELTLSAPSTYCDGPLELDFTAPSDLSRPLDCTDPPSAAAYNCISTTVDAGNVDVAFEIAYVSVPAGSALGPGSVILITGSGFGPSGHARFSGVAAESTWSDNAIVVAVPSRVPGGDLTLQRAGDLQGAQLGPYSVVRAAAAVLPAPKAPGPEPHPAALLAAHTRPLVYADPASRKPPVRHAPAIAFRLLVAHHVARPGARVAFTVKFIANGKPVAGAAVSLRVMHSPGKDTRLLTKSGKTNRAGLLRGTVVLSKHPGRTCVEATSGRHKYSVCITALTRAKTASSISLPFGLSGPHPVSAWLATGGVALVLLGILVNINVLGRSLWSHTVGRLMRSRQDRAIQA